MEEPIQKVGRLAKLKQIIVIGVPAVIESIISVIISTIQNQNIHGPVLFLSTSRASLRDQERRFVSSLHR